MWFIGFIVGLYIGQEYKSFPRLTTLYKSLEKFSKEQKEQQDKKWYDTIFK